MDISSFIWEEKYRPKTLSECILPNNLRTTLEKLSENENFPTLIFHGTSGIGKTTVARAIVETLNLDYIIINASLHGNIDTLRNEIMKFASTVSFKGKRKIVILDEADYLNPNSTQPALRNFIDEYKENCGFILTANTFGRIIDALHSRSYIVEFKIPNKEKPEVAMKYFKRCQEILKNEGVTFDKAVLANVIQNNFPDFRHILTTLEGYSKNSKVVDSGILTTNQLEIQVVVDLLKSRNFNDIRNFVAENMDNFPNPYEFLYEGLMNKCSHNSIPDLILTIGKYQYQAAFVASQEINLAACIVELMTLELK